MPTVKIKINKYDTTMLHKMNSSSKRNTQQSNKILTQH